MDISLRSTGLGLGVRVIIKHRASGMGYRMYVCMYHFYLLYLFACAESLLQPVGSPVVACELLLVARGI